jgi:hypothetical protein
VSSVEHDAAGHLLVLGPEAIELVEQLEGGLGDDGARPEDGRGARGVERGVVLRRDDAAHHDQDVVAPARGQRGFSAGTSVRCPAASELTPTTCTSFSTACWAVSSGVWNSGRCRRRSRGRRRPCDHLLAPVVPVLAHLGDQDARPAALALASEPSRPAPRASSTATCRLARLADRTRPRWLADLGLVPAEDLLEREADLAHRGARARAASIASSSRLPSPDSPRR